VNYTWYIQKAGPITVVYGDILDDAAHQINLVNANNYRGGMQNHSSTANTYQVCYTVR
jgi:hypothetical protein